jgi:hypothetical protein
VQKESPWCGVSSRGLKKEASMNNFIKPYDVYKKIQKMSRGKRKPKG